MFLQRCALSVLRRIRTQRRTKKDNYRRQLPFKSEERLKRDWYMRDTECKKSKILNEKKTWIYDSHFWTSTRRHRSSTRLARVKVEVADCFSRNRRCGEPQRLKSIVQIRHGQLNSLSPLNRRGCCSERGIISVWTKKFPSVWQSSQSKFSDILV